MECLDKIIKLSRTDCNCFDADKPLDYNEGKSDIYLHELEGLNLDVLNQSSNCESGNIWELMSRARENATKQFKADLLGCIGSNYTNKRQNYSGLVGSTAFNATINYVQNKAGIVLKPYNIVGGHMNIKRIGLMFNTTSPLTISVFSNEDMINPIAIYNVTSNANILEFVNLSTPLKLPLWPSTLNTNIEYYFVYDLMGSYLPKNNKNCGGCGQTDANRPYASWLNVKGIVGYNTTPYNQFQNTAELNGLVIDAEFNCDSSRLICSEDQPLNFEGDGRAMQIAYAIRFKAGHLLLDSILSSPNINRYTMMDRESLYGKRNHYRAKYEEWIGWLCENTEVQNNDCLICRPNRNVIKGGILA